MIDSQGKVHIVDFGIALLRVRVRLPGEIFLMYWGLQTMAPEQIQGKRGDARTDLYALGIMLYEMVTGAVPFRGDNALSVMHQHLQATPPLPRQ